MKLTHLPLELLQAIFNPLAQKDRKKVRLVCRQLKASVPLCIPRLFISPNRTNLDVFKSVVAHEELSKGVEEIIWDDARLDDYAGRQMGRTNPYEQFTAVYFRKFDLDVVEDEFSPGVESQIKERKSDLWGEGVKEISLQESFRIYQKLYQEQEDIISQGEDRKALRMGLEKLPNIFRVTITSEAWRPSVLFPKYETPFFRSLLPGFKMPEPWPWLGERSDRGWMGYEEEVELDTRLEALANPWGNSLNLEYRGYSIVVRELLSTVSSHHVRELVIDVNREMTGICYQLFEFPPSIMYRNTIELFEVVTLTRFDLALNVNGAVEDRFVCFSNGLLQTALSKLTSLEHFHLHANSWNKMPDITYETDSLWVSMSGIFPESLATTWPKLKHLGLANFLTFPLDIYDALVALPSVKTVDIDNVVFPVESGEYRGLLYKVKETLIDPEDGAWRNNKPKITIRMVNEYGSTRRTTADDEITQFLYDGGECPFSVEFPGFINHPFGVILDDFNPLYKMPNDILLVHGEQEVILEALARN